MSWFDVSADRDAWEAALRASGHPSVLQSVAWGTFLESEGKRVRRFLHRDSSSRILGFQTSRLSSFLPLQWSPEGAFPILDWMGAPVRSMTVRRLNPILVAPMERDLLPRRIGLRLPLRLSHPGNVLVDLTMDEEQLLKKAHQKWRNALRSSRKKVATCREIDLDEFVEIDAKLRKEIEATKGFESPWTTDRIRSLGASELETVCVATFDAGEATSCMLSVISGSVAMLVTASTGERGRDHSAGYIAYWRSSSVLRRRGIRVWNLGGIDEEMNKGVARFKIRGGGDKLDLPGVFFGI